MSVPKSMVIDAMPLFKALQSAITHKHQGGANELVAITHFIKECFDILVQSFNEHRAFVWSEETACACKELGISQQTYFQLLSSFSQSIEPYLNMFGNAVSYYRYNHCVDIAYKMEADFTVTLKIFTTNFETDGLAILKREIRESLDKGEKVPHRFLEFL